jgi:hypothetical protein
MIAAPAVAGVAEIIHPMDHSDEAKWHARRPCPELLPGLRGLRHTTSSGVTAGAAAHAIAGSQPGSDQRGRDLAAPTSYKRTLCVASRRELIRLAPAIAEPAQGEDD